MSAPERRAAGAYYTPAHIVQYTLGQTLAPLLAALTPAQADHLRVLDPACGDGAFLVAAYRALLAWRLAWYERDGPERWPAAVRRGPSGWELAPEERRRVLLGSIYGVDLDAAALASARRSLAAASLWPAQAELERDLAATLRRGNALVGADLAGADERPALGAAERIRHHALDWGAAFPEAAGGFGAVVGNPPYQHLKRGFLAPELKRYFERRYRTAVGQYDAFALFVERALALLAPGGALGFVLPRPLLASQSYEPVRRLLLQQRVLALADAGAPFAGAAVESVVVVARRAAPEAGAAVRIDQVGQGVRQLGEVEQAAFARMPLLSMSYQLRGPAARLAARLAQSERTLASALTLLARGAEAGARAASVSAEDAPGRRRLLRGRDVRPFALRFAGQYYDPRAGGRREWKDERIYAQPEKLLLRRVSGSLCAALDREGFWTLNTLYTLVPAPGVDARLLLGCLNARLLGFYVRSVYLSDDRLFPYLRASQLGALPLPPPDAGRAQAEAVIAAVDRLLELHAEPDQPAARIAAARRELDHLVYALYALSPAEVALVEASGDSEPAG